MQELIEYIRVQPKRTPVKLYLWENAPVEFPGCRVFTAGEGCKLVFGDWAQIAPVLQENQDRIEHTEIECSCRNSALPLVDILDIPARIEPGAILREKVKIGKQAVIMMGAVINIGAQIGENTMIDMNTVIGGRAVVGNNCHIGAGAVLAGVIEPAFAKPVIIEDDVIVGANAVVLEGCRVGKGAVVGAGCIVTRDVPPGAVVAGCPGRIVKWKDERTAQKTVLSMSLRE